MALTAAFLARLREAKTGAALVPFRPVRFSVGRSPREHVCHENVAEWVRENPGDRVVKGWLLTSGFLADRHSVVRGSDGELFDITPLRCRTPFFAHPHDPEDEPWDEVPNQLSLIEIPL